MRGGYRIQANYDELEQVAQQFGTHGDGVSNLLQQVQRTAGDLQSGGWVGTGANAFFAEVSDLISPGLKRLTHSLSEAREAVLLICATFQEAEREASRQFDGGDPGARAVEGGEDEDKTIIAWSKFEPIGEHKLFVRGGGDGRKIHPNDVDQQSLGDCTVMAALATIADKNPDLIENAIRPNKDGSYTVTLYELTELPPPKDRIAHEITVTPEFPTASRINPETGDIVSRPKMHAGVGDESYSGKPEIWPLIMEKAYAQFVAEKTYGSQAPHLGYWKLDEGGHGQDVFEALTGVGNTRYGERSPHGLGLTDLSLDAMAEAHENGNLIMLSTKTVSPDDSGLPLFDNDTLVDRHAYYVTDVDPAAGTVTVRNPWGWDHDPIELTYEQYEEHFRSAVINHSSPN